MTARRLSKKGNFGCLTGNLERDPRSGEETIYSGVLYLDRDLAFCSHGEILLLAMSRFRGRSPPRFLSRLCTKIVLLIVIQYVNNTAYE